MRLKKIIKKNKPLFKVLSAMKNYSSIKYARYYDTFFSSIVEGTIVVRLKNIEGEYEIDARSDILKRILIGKEYEPEISDLILKKINPNKDAINIGANIGLYSNLLAQSINLNNKVLAIEPTPNAFKILKNNIIRNNNEDRIITFNGIATDKEGDYQINIIQGKEEYSSMGELVHTSIKHKKATSVQVKGNTIDNLIKQHRIKPGIMVIDVEGAELSVLKGAVKTLKEFRPIIISELDDKLLTEQNSNSKEIIKFLESFNYQVMDIEGGTPDFPFEGNIIAEA